MRGALQFVEHKKDEDGCGHTHAHHHHHHGHGHGHAHGRASDNLKVALFLNLGFAVIEVIGGYWTGSVAILSDAVHDFGDGLSLALAWFLERLASKQANAAYPYGYRRLSLLSALITCLILVAGSVAVLVQAVPRLMNPVMPKVDGMIAFALLGTAVNGYAAWRTHKGGTLNERVVSWHLIEDVLGWVAVLISAIVMKFKALPILDPILSIVVTLFIFRGVFRSLAATLRLFLQAAPEGLDLARLAREIEETRDVVAAENLRVWSLDGESHVLTMRLVARAAAGQQELEAIKRQVRERVAKLGRFDLTIETQPEATVTKGET